MNTREEKAAKTSPVKKRWKRVRPTKFKIADEAALELILNPPPRFPAPEFKGLEYIHELENNSEYIFMCPEPFCEAKFATVLSLNIHRSSHTDPLIRCQFCGVRFKNEEERISHCKEFHPNLEENPYADPLQCTKCGKCSRDKKALWRHVRESHRDIKYPCPKCNFPFSRPENLKEHLKTKHPEEEGHEPTKYVCNICDREYLHQNTLRSHIRQVHRGSPEKTYQCVLCRTVYTQKRAYNQHMKRHIEPEVYPCHFCKTQYRSAGHLRRHEQTYTHKEITRKVNGPTEKNDMFPIPIIKTVKTANPNLTSEELIELCKKTSVKILLHRVDQNIAFRSTLSKRIHRKIMKTQCTSSYATGNVNEHAANQYLNCIYCNASLSDLKTVKEHERICYMKIRCKKLIICPVCNKEYDMPYRLRAHLRTHQKEGDKHRPFQCSYCDAFFISKATRKQHEKQVHFDIRAPAIKYIHKCPYEGCDKHYLKHSGLDEHIASRHVVKRSKCDKCGRTFRTERILKRHVSLIHAECPTLLQCKPCNRVYRSKSTYLNHLSKRRHSRKTREYERRKMMKHIT